MTWWGQDHLKVSRFCIKKEILRFHLIVLYSNFPDKLWKQFVKNSFWCIVQNCFERLWTSFGDPKPIAAQPSCPSVNVLQLLEEILRDAFYTNLDQSWNYTLRANQLEKLEAAKAAWLVCLRGHSQMTSALFGVSDTPWWLCQPIISFWPPRWCFKLMTSFVNSPEPKTNICRIKFISISLQNLRYDIGHWLF